MAHFCTKSHSWLAKRSLFSSLKGEGGGSPSHLAAPHCMVPPAVPRLSWWWRWGTGNPAAWRLFLPTPSVCFRSVCFGMPCHAMPCCAVPCHGGSAVTAGYQGKLQVQPIAAVKPLQYCNWKWFIKYFPFISLIIPTQSCFLALCCVAVVAVPGFFSLLSP